MTALLCSPVAGTAATLQQLEAGSSNEHRRRTLEIEGNIGIALAVIVESIAPIVASVLYRRLGYLEREHESVSTRRLARHADSAAALDHLLALVPRDLGRGVRLQDALHDEDVSFLADGRLLREPRRFAGRNPKECKDNSH